jgi:uncharacterized protein YgiB involved in biofilm formation
MSGEGPRWRSRTVDLVLLGTAGSLMTLLGGCSGSNTSYSSDYHRNVYASAEDCAKDYSAISCTPKAAGSTQYLGPPYRVIGGVPRACHSSDMGPGRNLVFSPRVDVVRGGFGPRCSQSSSSRSWRTASWGG